MLLPSLLLAFALSGAAVAAPASGPTTSSGARPEDSARATGSAKGSARAARKAGESSKSVAPHLPAPIATVYAHAPGTPKDPVVATALAGAAWDEALAGAAAGVALEVTRGGTADAYTLRWSAVLAAYPYPIVEKSVTTVAYDEVPAALVEVARARAAAGFDVGVVRAREARGDVWVLLVGRREAELGRIPRELGVGETLALPDASFVLADPSGRVRKVGRAITFDVAGEWLLQARRGPDVLATMPLYVGMDTPKEAPILDDAQGDDLAGQVRDLLGALGNWYGRDGATFDPMLDSVARARLRTILDGGEPGPIAAAAKVVGYADVPVVAAECRAPSVAACLDGLWWNPERRAAIVGGHANLGIAAEATDSGVVVVVVGAG